METTEALFDTPKADAPKVLLVAKKTSYYEGAAVASKTVVVRLLATRELVQEVRTRMVPTHEEYLAWKSPDVKTTTTSLGFLSMGKTAHDFITEYTNKGYAVSAP